MLNGKAIAIIIVIAIIGSAFYFSSQLVTSAPQSHFIFGASGLSGSDYPSGFISTMTSKYGITAFRMDDNVFNGPNGDQIPKFVSPACSLHLSRDVWELRRLLWRLEDLT